MMLRRRSSSCSSSGVKGSNRRRRSSSNTAGFDEFGFAFVKRRERKVQHRTHDYSYPQPTAVKVKELCELLSYWNGASFICRNQIERFIRIGIPPALRGRVWKCLLDIETVRAASNFNYQVCLSEIRQPLVDLGVSEYSIISAISTLGDRENEMGSTSAAGCLKDDVPIFRQIALDLQRSFPTHRSLMGDTPEAIEGQAKLFRVLTAYARYNPQIGYSQGMSYIAAVLLMLLGEEEAFWALVVLLEKPKYLSELFDSSLKKIQHHALVFQQLLKHRKPQVFQHLEKLSVSSVHFIMQWFMTLFTSLPCWDSVLAIWDLFLLHDELGSSSSSPAPVGCEEQTEHPEETEQTSAEEKSEASGKEAVGSSGGNVFARMLKAAQRYLADTAKQSTAKKRKSESKQPQNTPMSRKGQFTPQDGVSAATDDSSPMPLRRLRSGPVGRVARRRSGAQSTRVRSLLRRTSRGLAQCSTSPRRNSCSKPGQYEASEEQRESPHRISSPEHTQLIHQIITASSPSVKIRESQLI
ncbi:Carabin [Bagarius yarrelli]|uniref:Carabin n=1 Tax=Bagarius yarrelli TaxID=175774 RepID=A0A556V2Z2_BAGYA|nr:Carabin [Bagarius yarrelli]